MKRFTIAVLVLSCALFGLTSCGGSGDALDAAGKIYDGYDGE